MLVRKQIIIQDWLWREAAQIAKAQGISRSEVLRIDSCLVKIEFTKALYPEYKPAIDIKRFVSELSKTYKNKRIQKSKMKVLFSLVYFEARKSTEINKKKKKYQI